jgi:hypothetical protein
MHPVFPPATDQATIPFKILENIHVIPAGQDMGTA